MLMAMIHHLKRQQLFMKEPWIPGNLLYVCAINNIHTVRVIIMPAMQTGHYVFKAR